MMRLFSLLALSFTLVAPLANGQSNNRYRTAISVNERVITEYEINQRANMLSVFGNQGDPRSAAIEQLIDERLYLQAGQDLGIQPNNAELETALDEFAARASLSRGELLDMFQARGISEESYRDFVLAGLTWQAVVQVRFSDQSEISEFEIENALRNMNGGNGREFRFSEIILPYGELGTENANKLALKLSNTLKDQKDFAQAARQYSKWPSAQAGGQVDWTDGSRLSPAILAQFLASKPGQITGPIPLPNGSVAIYLLQEMRDSKTQTPIEPEVIQYAVLNLPDTLGDENLRDATARVIRSEIDTCFDLREQAAPYGDESYVSYDSSQSATPADIAAALRKLDIKESATLLNDKSGQIRVVMVCNRSRALNAESLNDLRNSLLQRKFGALGNGNLQELRTEARIIR